MWFIIIVAYGCKGGYGWIFSPIFNRMRNNTFPVELHQPKFKDKLKDNGSWQSVYQGEGKKDTGPRGVSFQMIDDDSTNGGMEDNGSWREFFAIFPFFFRHSVLPEL